MVYFVVHGKDPLDHRKVFLDTRNQSLTPIGDKCPVIVVEFNAENRFQFYLKQEQPVENNQQQLTEK